MLDKLPVISFASFLDGSNPQAIADDIGTACREVGFFYLTHHGIDLSLIDRAFSQARTYFDRPLQAKMACHISKSETHRGYFPLFEENTDPAQVSDLKEGFDLGRDLGPGHPAVEAGLPLHGPNQWPCRPDGFQKTMEDYFRALNCLAETLMEAIALSLDLPRDYFLEYVDDPLAQLRLLHYPPQAKHSEDQTIGCGAHTDYGCLTILAVDGVSGLEVQTRKDQWVEVPPVPGAFVINLGDQMARWTNDVFRATPHRVVNRTGEERYSMPFFFDPNWHAEIECLESCQSRDNPARYEPVQAGPYLLSRLTDTFNYLQDKAAD